MKPNNDSEKPWEVISSEYLHKNLWLTVRKDHVVLPNGNHIPSYYILEYPNWVNSRPLKYPFPANSQYING